MNRRKPVAEEYHFAAGFFTFYILEVAIYMITKRYGSMLCLIGLVLK